MSEPEPGNGNVNTVYFVNHARGNTRLSRTEFVFDERPRDCKCLLRFELTALKNVHKNILLKISCCALTLQVNVRIFSTKFEG